MAAKRKQSEVKIAQRQHETAQLFLSGVPQYQIAKQLKVCAGTVSGDITAIVAQWKAQAIKDIDAAKVIEIEKCIKVEAAAWEGYELSKKVKRARGGIIPDSSFLNVALGAIALRCKILNIDNPTKPGGTYNSIHFHAGSGGIMSREKMREEVTRRLAQADWKSKAAETAITLPGRTDSKVLNEEPEE